MLLGVVTQKHFATEIIFAQGWSWGFMLPASQLLTWKPQEQARHSLGIYTIPQNPVHPAHAMCTCMAFEQKLLQYVFSLFSLFGAFVYLFITTISLKGDLLWEALQRIPLSLLCSYQKDNYERGIKLTSFRGQAFTSSFPVSLHLICHVLSSQNCKKLFTIKPFKASWWRAGQWCSVLKSLVWERNKAE